MKGVTFVNDRKHLKASDRIALQFLEMSNAAPERFHRLIKIWVDGGYRALA
ncbi:hypothetical protein [Moorena sp. SIO4G3]|uniref:hypothetical protein n=1 Tax=Moorena sp. SIO4G3 TaxID=2607821 RepID=UPI00142A6FC0|nr:hypothetical protein [Moorena sp. SIO4G3]NEO81998.1 hypothetical protein [Moorena sp. SIO4G3]